MSAEETKLFSGNAIEERAHADGASNVYYADTGLRMPHGGVIVGWRVFARNTRPVELVLYRGEPGALRVVGRSGVVTPAVGANELRLAAPIECRAGDIVGWYTPTTGSPAFDRPSGPWNTGDLSGRVLFAWGHETRFSGSSDRIYSIGVISYPSAAAVKIAEVDAIGGARREAAREYVEITNVGDIGADISGWRVVSQRQRAAYVFPAGVTLDPGQVVRVYSDHFDPATGGFTFGRRSAIWRNKGDVATLVDAGGEVISTFAYGDAITPERAPVEVTLELVDDLTEVTRPGVANVVDFIVLQLNDVYEAPPVEGGRLGGLARAATLQRRLKAENPRLLSVMIGDFLAPSAIGATTRDGGQHMIECLNAMGLTHATIGNHEFDVGEADLIQRIAESEFLWVVSNVSTGEGKPFPRVARHDLVAFENDEGEQVRVALLGVCLDMVKAPWIQYKDPIDSAREQVALLADKADVFLAMTHLTIDQDKALGAAVPRLDVLLGGHEHQAAKAIVGDDATPIFKADSNARSACVHRFRFDTRTGVTKLHTELVVLDERFEPEPAVAAVVEKWQKITFDTLRAQGTEPNEVVGVTKEALDGYEAKIRSGETNLTRFLTETFLQEAPECDGVVFPAGGIRIDGVIPAGEVTFFDVVRIFPKNLTLSVLQMPGSFLRALLEMGTKAAGTGAYPALRNFTRDDEGWQVKGERLDDARDYKVIFTGLPSAALSYPPFRGSGTVKLFDTRDVRSIVADRFRRDSGA